MRVPGTDEPAIAEGEKALRKAARLRDARSLRSQEALKNALLRLVEVKPLSKITLREITVDAGVSYPTFFNHYDDKEDLFDDIVRSEIGGLLLAFREGRLSPDWRPGRGMCAYVVERRSLWRTLLTTGASEAMRSEFIRHGHDIAGDRTLSHGVPIDVISGVIASATFEIIAWWLGQEEDTSAASVADILETIVIEPALNLPRGYFTGRAK
jgi:AcrR family transcriptional regulator